MPSLNFQSQFAPGIMAMLDKNYAKRTGIKPKTTTIRAKRKHTIKKGDILYLFVALRTKQCQRLGQVVCKKTEEICIDATRDRISIDVDGFALSLEDAQALAENDGFENVRDMVRWFKVFHGLPFHGDRIHFTTTYDSKYYFNRKVKAAGYHISLEQTEKTIFVNQLDVEEAKKDKYIQELAVKHGYGVQIVNPLMYLIDN
jgi:hypothetical protein